MGYLKIVIDDKLEREFRKRFIRKKGDLSNKIQELIKNALKKK